MICQLASKHIQDVPHIQDIQDTQGVPCGPMFCAIYKENG